MGTLSSSWLEQPEAGMERGENAGIHVALVSEEWGKSPAARLLAREPGVTLAAELSAFDFSAEALSRAADLIVVETRGADLGLLIAAQLLAHGARVMLITRQAIAGVNPREIGLADWLMAPLTEQRLSAALGTFRRRPAAGLPHLARLAVKNRERVLLIPVEEVRWIEAAGNYARLCLRNGTSQMLRSTLSELEQRLDPDRFVRVHRSTIVQVSEIVELRPTQHGDYFVVLQGGIRLRMTSSYREQLRRVVGRF